MKYPNFMTVTTYFYRLCRTLCELSWGFQVIYNGDDQNDPRIEFVYCNQFVVIRTNDEAKQWYKILRENIIQR